MADLTPEFVVELPSERAPEASERIVLGDVYSFVLPGKYGEPVGVVLPGGV